MNTTTLLQAPDQYQMMLNNYASIVEKTNQHMNYWFDPYVLIIASLTILFTLGAIIVAILIYVNGAEAKKQRNKIFEELERNVEEQKKIIKERNEREELLSKTREEKVKKYETSLNELIANYNDRLSKVGKDNMQEIERLEKAIEELNKSKASLGSYAVPEAMEISPYDVTLFGSGIRQMTCYGCGKRFQYKDKNNPYYGSFLVNQNKKVYCPHCGAENYV